MEPIRTRAALGEGAFAWALACGLAPWSAGCSSQTTLSLLERDPPEAVLAENGGEAGLEAEATEARTVPGSAVSPRVVTVAARFGPARLLTEVSQPEVKDDDPSLTGDRLELYFDSDRSGGMGGGDVWVAKRAAASEPWGAPMLVSEVSSASKETTPFVSADGLSLWLASDRAGGVGKDDLWVAQRTTRDAAWSEPVLVEALSSEERDFAPALSASGLWLALTSRRAGGSGGADLYQAARIALDAPWSIPVALVELNTADADREPCLVADGRVLYFSSNRSGDDEIYRALRASPSAVFLEALPVRELNSPANDGDPWVSEDGRYVVWRSDRAGDADLYEAELLSR